jgi:hypothetical protein
MKLAASSPPNHVVAQVDAGRALMEDPEQRVSWNVHSAGAGSAWPEAAGFFSPNSHVCKRSR